MHPTRTMSLKAKLLLTVAGIVLLGFVVTIAALSVKARNLQRDSSLAYATELANRHGLEVQNTLNQAMNTAKVVADALNSARTHGKADRAAADAVMKGVLAGNPQLLGVWTGWEPNAFDGKDSEHVGQAGHDGTGRYIPYWNRGSGSIQLEPLVDYDKPGAGDYYLLPKQTGVEVLIEPYVYPVAGKDTLITSLVVPIMDNGKFLGVAGVDIALANLQESVSKIAVMETGRASLVSNGGLYVGDRDATKVGKPMAKEGVFDAAVKAIQTGRPHQLHTDVPDLGGVTQVYVPINVGKVTTPWSFVAEVSDAKVFEGVAQLTWMALVLCAISILVVVAVLGYAINKMVLQPIGGDPTEAAAMANRVAQGDLSQPIRVVSGDTHSLMAQLKHMQDSLGQVVSNVRRGAQGVALASAEISQGNQDLSARTESQASAIEETAASMEELGGTVRQNADNAQQANQHAQNAYRVAAQGGEVMNQVVGTMKDISDSSRRIADIIGVIDGIAFQTNILALNAAVEAARAGEQGRGFAVVASEVRSLAQRSAGAAKEIKQLIDASVARVDAGNQQVDRAGAIMQDVLQAIQAVSAVMGEISTASQEQSNGVGQIGEAMANMDRSTQQNAAMVEEMAAAAQSLKGQSAELVQAVEVFKLHESGSTALALR